MPYISNETLIGAALLVVLAFGYQYLPIASNPSATAQAHQGAQSKSSKKRNKKKAAKFQPGPSHGHRESDSIALGQQPEKSTPKTAQHGHDKGIKGVSNAQADKIALGEVDSDLKEEITQGKEKGKTQQKKKLLAEKLLPKEPKTKVDDMLAPEDRPGQIARVMKVTSSKPSTSTSTAKVHPSASMNANSDGLAQQEETNPDSASNSDSGSDLGQNGDDAEAEARKIPKFENDYVDVSDPEISQSMAKAKGKANDGWDVVTSKKKKPSTINISSSNGNSNSNSRYSNPFSSLSTSLPLPPGAASRQQKKNAKKAEGKKLAREAEEVERQRRLALHRKDLERERINELYAAKQSNPNRGKALGGGGSRNASSNTGSGAGTGKATLTENGKLVWD
ncbi:uncharacterized protein I303_102707 [Kwoniella dejecticola CBS 10117]|uniref:Uncharacterized protein n=1 Tax=Kwoniella dejecticola CBS 10117 TaxID=1296121 RepID=A0A1A6A9H1_9TREE|nr:uncharacterized protein I303_02722 [Kwoniella dejecticola CBS 10117]OBR86710.1 hypothetical protein I303_02722 [Kwoniella dejecticola CBS 10117]